MAPEEFELDLTVSYRSLSNTKLETSRFVPTNDNREATQSLEKGGGGGGVDYFVMQIIFVCLNCYLKKIEDTKTKGLF